MVEPTVTRIPRLPLSVSFRAVLPPDAEEVVHFEAVPSEVFISLFEKHVIQLMFDAQRNTYAHSVVELYVGTHCQSDIRTA